MNKILKVGDNVSLRRAFSEAEVRQFAELSTDFNPIHLDHEFASQTRFGQRIVHGMLVSSMFSGLIGQHLPGDGSVYMGQNLKFTSPVFLDQEILAKVEITAIRPDKPIVTLATTCEDADGKLLVAGEAVVFVPWLTVSG